ncbi:MAG: multicopper oxidase domain-containing protein [Halobacteriota archaeon]
MTDDTLFVELTNDLQEETTIHWHGIPVPNPVDGVPNVTQASITSGEIFTYTALLNPSVTDRTHVQNTEVVCSMGNS